MRTSNSVKDYFGDKTEVGDTIIFYLDYQMHIGKVFDISAHTNEEDNIVFVTREGGMEIALLSSVVLNITDLMEFREKLITAQELLEEDNTNRTFSRKIKTDILKEDVNYGDYIIYSSYFWDFVKKKEVRAFHFGKVHEATLYGVIINPLETPKMIPYDSIVNANLLSQIRPELFI